MHSHFAKFLAEALYQRRVGQTIREVMDIAMGTRSKYKWFSAWLRRRLISLLLGSLGLVLISCTSMSPSSLPPTGDSSALPTHTASFPITPLPTVAPPSPEATAAAFLSAWQAGQYADMYRLVSPPVQAAMDVENFTARYQEALQAATVLTITTQLQAALREGDHAYVAFQLTLETALVGALSTDVVMPLGLYDQQWRVDWDEGLIWPQLAGGHYFQMRYTIRPGPIFTTGPDWPWLRPARLSLWA